MDPATLLGPADVARLFGVTPDAVRRWERLGQLPALRTAGGRRLFRLADVEALRARREQSPAHQQHTEEAAHG